MAQNEFEQVMGWLCGAFMFNMTGGAVIGFLVAAILRKPLGGGIALGMLAGPIGWILVGFLDEDPVGQCPECRGTLVDAAATRCRHCGAALARAPVPPERPPLPPPIQPTAGDITLAPPPDEDVLDWIGTPPKVQGK